MTEHERETAGAGDVEGQQPAGNRSAGTMDERGGRAEPAIEHGALAFAKLAELSPIANSAVALTADKESKVNFFIATPY